MREIKFRSVAICEELLRAAAASHRYRAACRISEFTKTLQAPRDGGSWELWRRTGTRMRAPRVINRDSNRLHVSVFRRTSGGRSSSVVGKFKIEFQCQNSADIKIMYGSGAIVCV